MNKENIVINVKNIVTRFGERTVHNGVSLVLERMRSMGSWVRVVQVNLY